MCRRKTSSEAPGTVQERGEHGIEKRDRVELGLTGWLNNVGAGVAERGKKKRLVGKVATRVLTEIAKL